MLERFFATLDPKDPTFPARKKGFAELPSGYAMMFKSSFIMFGDSKGCSETSRARLLGYLEVSLPQLYPVLASASREEVLTRLREFEANPQLAFARDRLRTLREKLVAK